MTKRNTVEPGNMTDRLRQLERLLAPRVVAPRAPADDLPAPLLAVERHQGRMYVFAGSEPRFRDVTLLQRAHAPREAEPEAS
ncbi:hypothetical protein [Nocardioides currus]|uniref:Uncharacterized protein n=1 Tax=Nocardioides currus TaxID=2133958 RepID=A0A2R7YYN0_9ACTN|nr:hypothetical protein [Nocardioides currus]PUA81414.1 hypothetical protein C7S10_10410 [Nocardioides currus]